VSVLTKAEKIYLYPSFTIHFVLCAWETYGIFVCGKKNFQLFVNKVQREISGLEKREGNGRHYITRNMVI
jgi:hypothetical protein